MCHDGFPVKKLIGADGSELVGKLDTLNVEEAIRKALISDHRPKGSRYVMKQAVVRDPYLIENVHVELLHPGNKGSEFYAEDFEEVLVMRSRDGAGGLFYGLKNVYYADLAGVGDFQAK